MVLHYPGGIDLTEFGIEIPVAPDRTQQVLTALESDPGLAALPANTDGRPQWLLGPDGSQITQEDLLRVHAPE